MPPYRRTPRANVNEKRLSAAPVSPKDTLGLNSSHYDFLSFLSIAQDLGVEFFPQTWEPGRALLGVGASGRIHESRLNIDISLAFKRAKAFGFQGRAEREFYRAWMMEVAILRHPLIHHHPNVIDLSAISWEINPSTGQVLPVLVFKKSQHGDLSTFLAFEGEEASFQVKIRLCLDIASAMLSLHSCGVIHGDIKPENILVFSKDGNDKSYTAKMTDFGYSCYGLRDDDTVNLPQSAPWNAPEYHGGDVTHLDAKKMDVYSFGLVCFWIIFYQSSPLNDRNSTCEKNRLFEIKNTRRTMLELINQIKEPSNTDGLVSSFVAKLKVCKDQQLQRLQQFFASALNVNTKHRSNDWAKYILILNELLDTSPQPTATMIEEDKKFSASSCDFEVIKSWIDLELADFRVRQYIFKALTQKTDHACQKCTKNAAFQVAICQTLGFGVPRNPESAKGFLEKSGRSTEDLDNFFGALQIYFGSGLSSKSRALFGGYEVGIPDEYQTQGLLGQAESAYKQEIKDRLDVLPCHHGSIQNLKYMYGRVLQMLNRWNEAQDIYSGLYDLKKILFGEYAGQTLICAVQIGYCAAKQHKLAEAEEVLRYALSHFDEESRNALSTMNILIEVLQIQGSFNAANETIKRYLEICLKVEGDFQIHTISAWLNLAYNKFLTGEWEDAERITHKMVDMQKRILGTENASVLTSMSSLARIYVEQGQVEKALQIQEREVEIFEQSLGKNSISANESLSNLGLIHYKQGNLEEAEKYQTQAIAATNELLGEDHPLSVSMSNELSRTYRGRLKIQEALACQQRVLEASKSTIPYEHPKIAIFVAELAAIYAAANNWNMAEKHSREALRVAIISLGSDHPWTLYIRAQVATIFRSQGLLKKAREIEEELYLKLKEFLGPKHENTLVLMHNLSLTCRDMREFQRAETLQDEILAQRLNIGGNTDNARMQHMQEVSIILYTRSRDDDLKKCRELQEQVSAFRIDRLGFQHAETLEIRYALATTYHKLGLLDQALAIQEEDLPRHTELYGPNHQLTIMTQTELGTILTELKFPDRAKENFRQALAASEAAAGGAPSYSTLAIRYLLAKLRHDGGETQEAIEDLRRILAEADQELERFRDLVNDVEASIIFYLMPVDLLATIRFCADRRPITGVGLD